jgi:hypothetical protein
MDASWAPAVEELNKTMAERQKQVDAGLARWQCLNN